MKYIKKLQILKQDGDEAAAVAGIVGKINHFYDIKKALKSVGNYNGSRTKEKKRETIQKGRKRQNRIWWAIY